jgi:hypothetical protein
MSLLEPLAALPEALSLVAAEAPARVLSLAAPRAHSYPGDATDEQGGKHDEM